MSSSKKIDLYRDFAVGVYLSEAPSRPRFLFGVVKHFVGFESGQIQSFKLLQNMASNSTPYPLPPYTLYTHVHSILIHTMEGGESWTREKVRGETVYKVGSKIPTWLNVSGPVNSDKRLLQSPFTG